MLRGITRPVLGACVVPALAVALGPALVAGTGCTASGGDESILVIKNVVGTAASSGGCTLSSSDTELGLVDGAFDVTAGVGYQFVAQLKSRITAAVGQESQRTIFTRGANIDLTFSDPTVFSAAELADLNTKNLLHFMSPFSAPIAPNGGVTDVPFELIPVQLADALASKMNLGRLVILASFTVVGDLAGGDVTSQKFSFPVTVMPLLNDLGPCSGVSATFMARSGNPCSPLQDGVVDCCTRLNNRNETILVCPAKGTGM